MNALLDAFWRSVAYCLHPKVIGLSLLPLLLVIGLIAGLGYLYMDPALAAVQAQAAWRLRSLQYWSPRLDSGAIAAFARNPGSAALIPVHLWLLVEQQQR